jgi:hypothetical protein
MRPLTVEEIQADNRRMRRFVCGHLPAEGARIVLADGPEGGPAWADLTPIWDDDYAWDGCSKPTSRSGWTSEKYTNTSTARK